MLIGIRVICNVCGHTKAPVGRSVPPEMYVCDDDCKGYRQDPLPGSLWPGETEEEFGYPIGKNATKEISE